MTRLDGPARCKETRFLGILTSPLVSVAWNASNNLPPSRPQIRSAQPANRAVVPIAAG